RLPALRLPPFLYARAYRNRVRLPRSRRRRCLRLSWLSPCYRLRESRTESVERHVQKFPCSVSYSKWECPPASLCEALRAGKLLAAIEVFNQTFEIIFIDSDDRHFALRVLDGIRCMRGVNHDRLPELLSNRTGRRLCWISRAEAVANFAHGVHSLINNGDRLFRSRRAAFFWMTFAGFF